MSFKLTDYSELKGCGCKLPQQRLLSLLKKSVSVESSEMIGMDSAVIPLSNGNTLVQTTDFFAPLVDDPFDQGCIAAANVLSDLYAMGVTNCDSMLMILAICRNLSDENLQDEVTSQIIKGFHVKAKEADTIITGGQTIFNPWFLIGGVATAVLLNDEKFINPVHSQSGNILILTKPLGTQVAVNAHTWLRKEKILLGKAQKDVTPQWNAFPGKEELVKQGYNLAIKSMSALNRKAAILMHKYNALAATDVTGFGILGHANNLCSNQQCKVDFTLEKLPIINGMELINEHIHDFGLLRGTSAETSGGLLIAVESESVANEFIKDLGIGWIVGRVVYGSNQAKIVANPEIIKVAQIYYPFIH